MWFLLAFTLTWCNVSVLGALPASSVCYQHADIPNACVYGNLTVALIGKTLKANDCNIQISIKSLESPPSIYINTTNSTDRFTVLMVDLGPQGRGPAYLQWMVTNVSINSLPNYHQIPPNNILAGYEKPLLMSGSSQPTLIQILVFRHQGVLRVPFGELWVSYRRNLSFSTLFSNTNPNLRLCGPVAGTQYWVHNEFFTPPNQGFAAPPNQGFASPPNQGFAAPPQQPVYVPMVPVQQGYVPVGSAPGQPGQPSPPQYSNPKKSLAVASLPMKLLFTPLAVFTILIL